MPKTYNHYIDGQLAATYNQNEKRPLTLKEKIQRAKRAHTDARLVRILTK